MESDQNTKILHLLTACHVWTPLHLCVGFLRNYLQPIRWLLPFQHGEFPLSLSARSTCHPRCLKGLISKIILNVPGGQIFLSTTFSYNLNTSVKTPPTQDDPVIWLSVSEQLQNEPRGEIIFSADAIIIESILKVSVRVHVGVCMCLYVRVTLVGPTWYHLRISATLWHCSQHKVSYECPSNRTWWPVIRSGQKDFLALPLCPSSPLQLGLVRPQLFALGIPVSKVQSESNKADALC